MNNINVNLHSHYSKLVSLHNYILNDVNQLYECSPAQHIFVESGDSCTHVHMKLSRNNN